MMKIITAQGLEFEVNWAAVSNIDGSLRFSVKNTNLAECYAIFSDREHTKKLTRVFDESSVEFENFVTLFRVEQMANGIVVGLRQ